MSEELSNMLKKPKSPVIVFMIKEKERELIKFFKTNYPKVFNSDEPLPLARLIHTDLKKILKQNNIKFSSTQFFNAMRFWCSRLKYKIALSEHPYRFDLTEKELLDSPITPEEKEDARYAIKYHFEQKRFQQKKMHHRQSFSKPGRKSDKPVIVEYKKSRSR